jgi:hypothetical protein
MSCAGTSYHSASRLPKNSEICGGCLDMFTVNGLARHLAQTSNEACIMWRDCAQLESNEAYASDAPDIDHAEPSYFQGDLFGDNYTDASLTWSDYESDEDDISDLDYDPSIHTSTPSPSSSGFSDEPSPSPSPISIDEPTFDDSTTCATAEDSLYHPAKIEYFQGRAGEALPETATTEFEAYDLELGTGSISSKNPYHPFQTRIDWEVTKWAKLRGPSSTAFTELLAIDGVCVMVKHLYSMFIMV